MDENFQNNTKNIIKIADSAKKIKNNLVKKTKETKINWKKIFIVVGIILLSLFIFCAIFITGFRFGKNYYSFKNFNDNLNNGGVIQFRSANSPKNIDFSLFWDVWNYLEDYYVKSSNLDNQQMIYGAISGLVNSLNDPYSVFLTPEDAQKFNEDVKGSFSGIGIEIGMKNNILTVIAPIKDTPAFKAGLRAGDKILAIDNELTDGLILDEAVKKIRGEKGTTVTLTIMRDSFTEPKDFVIERDVINVPALELSFLDNNIAYLQLLNFNENSADEFYKAANQINNKKSPGIILDLRNNPGGYLEISVDIASYFLDKGEIVLREKGNDNREKLYYSSEKRPSLKEIPLVILTNEGTASAAEILAGALRDNRNIKIIGEKSFGKGSVQSLLPLKDSSMLKITIAEWFTPNGTAINDKGLEPDIKIVLTEDDWNNNKDPQLDKAKEIIKNELNINNTKIILNK
jgi:carboxyl-terminal processing protease